MSEISPKIFYSSTSIPKDENLVLVFSSASTSNQIPTKCRNHVSSSSFLSSDNKLTKEKLKKKYDKIHPSKALYSTYALRSKKNTPSVLTNKNNKHRKETSTRSTELLTLADATSAVNKSTTSEKLPIYLFKEVSCSSTSHSETISCNRTKINKDIKKLESSKEISNFSDNFKFITPKSASECLSESRIDNTIANDKPNYNLTYKQKLQKDSLGIISQPTLASASSTANSRKIYKQQLYVEKPSTYTLRPKKTSVTSPHEKGYCRIAISRNRNKIETTDENLEVNNTKFGNLPMSLSEKGFNFNESASNSHIETVACNINEITKNSEVLPEENPVRETIIVTNNVILPYSIEVSKKNELNSDKKELAFTKISNLSDSVFVPNESLFEDMPSSGNDITIISDYENSRGKECNSNQTKLAFNENLSVEPEAVFHNFSNIRTDPENNLTNHHENVINSTERSNFSDSSVFVANESLSEYMPNSTNDITIASDNSISLEIEKSINEIKSPLNVTKVIVPHSSQSKKHFCIFCKTLQTKLARHFFLKHKSENEIKAISTLPKKHIDRLKMLNKLRKDGDFLHNTSHSLNTGILIVSRQQNSKAKNNSDDYVCCRNCKGFFSKRSLKFHIRTCGKYKKYDRTNMIHSRRMTQYMLDEANEILKTKIFPVLRNDEITNAIRYDDLIIKYDNKMSQKYTLTHQHDMIRSQLRLLGRFKICVQELCPAIKNLKEIFKPQMHDTCIKAVHKVAKWDNTLMLFKTPAVAQSLTSLIKKCGYKQKTEFIKTQEDGLKKDVEDFLQLWEEEVPVLINKKACEDQANQKRIKKIILPTKEDIKKLYMYLKSQIMTQINSLQDKFCSQSWIDLIKSTLIFIQIFNRRRAGEIERLTLSNYKNKEVITDNVEEALLKEISAASLQFAKQFVRIVIRGKLGRTVGVLLSPLSISAIEMIIKHRETAGIPTSNEYIFSKTTTSKLSKPYFRACPLLRQFSTVCGAMLPESLRGTTLRKHIATYTSLLNVEEATVDKLANFMGHHKDIHKNIYRTSVPVTEITCVSQLLTNAVGCDDDEMISYMADGGKEANNESETADEDSSDSADSTILEEQPKKRKRSTSPYGKTKRSRWNEDEKQAVLSHFGRLKDLKKLPSLVECMDAIQKLSVLKTRTPQQLKTWIDNQRRHK